LKRDQLFQDSELEREAVHCWLRFRLSRCEPRFRGVAVACGHLDVQFASFFAFRTGCRCLLLASASMQIFAFRLHQAILRLDCDGHIHQC
jgi:hypothetical protein